MQLAAAVPALSLTPWLNRMAGAVDGDPVGPGETVGAGELAGVSLSWIGERHEVVATVQAGHEGGWGPGIEARANHGHGPADPDGRQHSPPILVPGASAYRIVPTGMARDLRTHTIPASRGPLTLSALSTVEPVPGLEIIERSNWTAVARRDTYDCVIGSSVLGAGCRSDVGLRHAIVHHTVSVNDYEPDEVAMLLRGIQTYHMHTRGWDDIAYSFVIDRWGGIWQAREGDITEPITGGHTTGLNAESVGVAVLGTFTAESPHPAVIDSLSRLLGWKLSIHGVDPLGTTSVRSAGGDYAAPGEMVTVRNIAGHREHQNTTCPGDLLSATVDGIRADAAELVPIFGHLRPTYSLDSVVIEGWAIDRFDPDHSVEVEVVVDGGSPVVLIADEHEEGLDADYAEAGAAHGFSHTITIDLATTSILVSATAADGRVATLMNLTLFATFSDVEPQRFFAPGVWFLREKGLTTGTLPGLFEPMDLVTRAQMATFLHRFMDLPAATGDAPFVDVVPGSFYEEAVNWLHGSGITTGTSPAEFSPEAFVTRAQMATFLWRLCGEIAPSGASPFADVVPGKYYADPVAWLHEIGVATGLTPRIFAPDHPVTRGEKAIFLQRLATTPAAWAVVEPPSSVET